jgi:hypothetical protein
LICDKPPGRGIGTVWGAPGKLLDPRGARAVIMGPERDTAVRYLSALVSRYRDEIAVQRRALAKLGSNLGVSGLIVQLQGLREDAAELLARLRGRRQADIPPDPCGPDSMTRTPSDRRLGDSTAAPAPVGPEPGGSRPSRTV